MRKSNATIERFESNMYQEQKRITVDVEKHTAKSMETMMPSGTRGKKNWNNALVFLSRINQ